jgi:Tol biopolymer transport system component
MLALALSAAIAGGVPASAQATLAFVRGIVKPYVWSAADDGSSQHRLAAGTQPKVSPDGRTVAYMQLPTGAHSPPPRLMVVPAAGGKPRMLAGEWRDPFSFAWSADSRTIATVLGPETGKQHLVLIDVRDGSQRTVATGYFSGVSFSPDGARLVYAMATSERFPPRSDVYRVAVAGGSPVAITHDRRSLTPLWGAGGRIVFVKLLNARRRLYGPKNELFSMNPDGGAVRRLTHTVVGQLVQGLTPTQWSANGTRLLSEFTGQDTSYAVTVDPKTGAQRPVGRAEGLVATALSSNGRLILGYTGFLGPGPHDVVAVPYRGGKPRLLARGGYEPAWNR